MARIATIGINPSIREFVDPDGIALAGPTQRLPTLDSMGLTSWSALHSVHIRSIALACRSYFERNPYLTWFRPLQTLLHGSDASYFGPERSACHLDLVPYTTVGKWSSLPLDSRRALLESTKDALGLLLREFSIDLVVLNGQAVVNQFESLTGSTLRAERKDAWTLPRSGGRPVEGIAYTGSVGRIGDVTLPRPVKVLGYNHNLQSSFGVTSQVVAAIGRWIGSRETT